MVSLEYGRNNRKEGRANSMQEMLVELYSHRVIRQRFNYDNFFEYVARKSSTIYQENNTETNRINNRTRGRPIRILH